MKKPLTKLLLFFFAGALLRGPLKEEYLRIKIF